MKSDIMENDRDLFAALAAKEEGMAKVEDNSAEFQAKALEFISYLAPGEYLGEDIAYGCKIRGIIPHHPNAWGALIRTAIARGILQETGRWAKARSVKNHASRYPIYRKA